MHLHHLQVASTLCLLKLTKLLKLLILQLVYLVPAYKKHQHRAGQMEYAATKQQIPRSIKIL